MSIWSDINNNYTNEDQINKGIIINHIDAWYTQDANESGTVIAKVITMCKNKAKAHTDKPNVEKKDTVNYNDHIATIFVEYLDERAKTDTYAQEVINDSIKQLKNINL